MHRLIENTIDDLFLLAIVSFVVFGSMNVAHCQIPTAGCQQLNQIVTGVQAGSTYDNRSTKCTVWKVTYFGTHLTSLSLQFETAPDTGGTPGSFTAASNVVFGQNPMTGTISQEVVINSYAPWVRVNVTAFVGNGAIDSQVNYSLNGTNITNSILSIAPSAPGIYGPFTNPAITMTPTLTSVNCSSPPCTTNVITLGETAHKHTLAVIVTGTPATCTIELDGSLDNTNFFNLSGSQTCTANVMFHVIDRPVTFVRAQLTAFSGGSSPTVQVFYAGLQ